MSLSGSASVLLDPLRAVEKSEVFYGSDIRMRRAHEKSRAGCVACKLQRKKCDEAKPRCSRCTSRGRTCTYSGPKTPRAQFGISKGSPDFGLKPITSASPNALPALLTRTLAPATGLDATELSLLGHYLSRTSRIIPIDNYELYVLQVGFPTLAFGDATVMSSLLALSAVSKCFDIVHHPDFSPQCVKRLRKLFVFADDHFSMALRELRSDLQKKESYDHVLASAALMVLYGLASRCVRVQLLNWSTKRGCHLSSDMLPLGSQWLSLVRAAHLAYIGVCEESSADFDGDTGLEPAETVDLDFSQQVPTIDDISSHTSEDGPSPRTKSLFYPLVAATYSSAFSRLRSKADTLVTATFARSSREGSSPDANTSSGLLLQSCFDSLETLSRIGESVFSTDRQIPISKAYESSESEAIISSGGIPCKVSAWLARYLARVTSNAPTKPLRRTITAFLNIVPAPYLDKVQSISDRIPQHDVIPGKTTSSRYLDRSEQLALDIFAHWLVFVMLLDGVWWIGNVGEYELERVVRCLEDSGWVEDPNQTWWPRSMLNLKKDLS